MKLAIVGSRELAGDQAARRLIVDIINAHMTDDEIEEFVIVSGGAVGIDQMAAEVARTKGLPLIEHLPEAKSWPAYRKRNRKIAQDCDKLIRIVSKRSRTYGSGWTRDRAIELGKPTQEYVLP